jgi:hypothetical protein
MAKQVVTAGYLTLGATDYSAQVANASLTLNVEEGDTTNYASSGWKSRVAGLIDGQLAISFKQDSDLSGLEAAVWTASAFSGGAGTIAFAARKSSDAIGAANPEYQGTVLITQLIVGPRQLGQVLGQDVTWPTTGSVIRDIQP